MTMATDQLQLFEWRDFVDIAIVAYLFYRAILLLKDRLAFRFFLFIAGGIALFFFSRLAGLDAFHAILSALFKSLILILVVLFQSDLRRALITFGKRNRPAGQEHEEASLVIDELVTALTGLAERRIGALIVIEREMGVMSHVEIGTEIDAKITSEILNSIFLPYSPIHDGAVIIQRGKLTRAGCFLPLSQNPTISKSLGTRHRAAIGLTELVDAIVLVVSEETGMMSFVADGKITSPVDAGSMRKVLKRSLEPQWLT